MDDPQVDDYVRWGNIEGMGIFQGFKSLYYNRDWSKT